MLTAVAGPHVGQVFSLTRGLYWIGREQGCAIKLCYDNMVSRSHARIEWNGSGWILNDNNSTNGCWVNGVRTQTRLLNLGDQIGVGQSILRVDAM